MKTFLYSSSGHPSLQTMARLHVCPGSLKTVWARRADRTSYPTVSRRRLLGIPQNGRGLRHKPCRGKLHDRRSTSTSFLSSGKGALESTGTPVVSTGRTTQAEGY